MTAARLLVDTHGRVLRDLRVSITGCLESVVARKEERRLIGGPEIAAPERSMGRSGS